MCLYILYMISNNEITLSANNRYFLHTPVQCNDENGKRQTQSVLIDNITDGSLWNMNTEKLKCSLLSSSPQQYTSVNQISAAQKGASLSSGNIEQCRSVSVYADANKKKVISGYITLDDYKNLDPSAVLNAPGSMPLTPSAVTPGPTPPPPGPSTMTPGPSPAPTQNLGQFLNDYLNPKPSPAGSPAGTQKEGFSTLINETDLLETNAFHKIKNNSIIRFYFVSLLVIFIYILHRISKKLLR